MDRHRRRCRLPAAVVAATLLLVAVHDEGRCRAAARPLMRRLHAVEETTEAPEASEAVLDVAAAEAPEGAVRWGGSNGEDALGAGKWLPLPMPMTLPAASALAGGLRFPPVVFPAAGASMPWLPGAPPALAGPGAGLPALGPPYVGATRQEQLSLWASLFNPLQVRARLPGPLSGETAAGQADRGVPAIASAGKAAEGEAMDMPAAGAVQIGEPKWGVFLGNIDHRN